MQPRRSLIAWSIGLGALVIAATGCRIAESRRLVIASIAYEQAGADPAVLVVGDSTGEGTGARDARLSIAGRLGAMWPDSAVVNLSRDGAKLAEIAMQLRGAPRRSYRLVLIMGGGNDILGGTPAAAFSSALTDTFSAAKTFGAPVIFMGAGNVGTAPMFHWPVSWWLSRRALAAQALYDRAAQSAGVHRVSLFYERSDDPFLSQPDVYYAADGLHPSDAGYGLWWQSLRETIDGLTRTPRAADPRA